MFVTLDLPEQLLQCDTVQERYFTFYESQRQIKLNDFMLIINVSWLLNYITHYSNQYTSNVLPKYS